VQIWRELELFGIHLVPANKSTWILSPVTKDDIPLMEIASKTYSKKGSCMINRCNFFLHLFSIFDLLIFNMMDIHPAHQHGEKPLSWESPMLWQNIPSPPKRYWKFWTHFLHCVTRPMLSTSSLRWCPTIHSRWTPRFFKHRMSPHLYSLCEGDLSLYKLKGRTRT
jgi:hypothetical protein